jgi:hypothetical protein
MSDNSNSTTPDARAISETSGGTIDDRARAEFGQSLQAEKWAVECNELTWKIRRSKLLAFRSRESGCSDAAALHDRDAAACKAQLAELMERMSR